MKSMLMLLTLMIGMQGVQAQKIVEINKIPSSIEAFLELRSELADSPEGAAALFVAAMLMYNKDKDLGTDAFTIAVDRSLLKEVSGGYKGFAPGNNFANAIRNYFAPRPYLANSYIKDTKVKDGYKLPKASPYEVAMKRNPHSEQSNGDIKVFVACSGADSPRPITLRKNNRGVWKVVNYSSLFVGIRKPNLVDDRL